MNRITQISLAILTCSLCACFGDHSKGAPPESEEVVGAPSLRLIHESDAFGDWVTVVGDKGTELCMFTTDAGEPLDYAHIADVCGWIPR